eukprot:1508451-Rhodomonas_salina.1
MCVSLSLYFQCLCVLHVHVASLRHFTSECSTSMPSESAHTDDLCMHRSLVGGDALEEGV